MYKIHLMLIISSYWI